MTLSILRQHKEIIDKRIAELERDLLEECPDIRIKETSLERFYDYLTDNAFENLHISVTPDNEVYITYDIYGKHYCVRFLSSGITKVFISYIII